MGNNPKDFTYILRKTKKAYSIDKLNNDGTGIIGDKGSGGKNLSSSIEKIGVSECNELLKEYKGENPKEYLEKKLKEFLNKDNVGGDDGLVIEEKEKKKYETLEECWEGYTNGEIELTKKGAHFSLPYSKDISKEQYGVIMYGCFYEGHYHFIDFSFYEFYAKGYFNKENLSMFGKELKEAVLDTAFNSNDFIMIFKGFESLDEGEMSFDDFFTHLLRIGKYFDDGRVDFLAMAKSVKNEDYFGINMVYRDELKDNDKNYKNFRICTKRFIISAMDNLGKNCNYDISEKNYKEFLERIENGDEYHKILLESMMTINKNEKNKDILMERLLSGSGLRLFYEVGELIGYLRDFVGKRKVELIDNALNFLEKNNNFKGTRELLKALNIVLGHIGLENDEGEKETFEKFSNFDEEIGELNTKTGGLNQDLLSIDEKVKRLNYGNGRKLLNSFLSIIGREEKINEKNDIENIINDVNSIKGRLFSDESYSIGNTLISIFMTVEKLETIRNNQMNKTGGSFKEIRELGEKHRELSNKLGGQYKDRVDEIINLMTGGESQFSGMGKLNEVRIKEMKESCSTLFNNFSKIEDFLGNCIIFLLESIQKNSKRIEEYENELKEINSLNEELKEKSIEFESEIKK